VARRDGARGRRARHGCRLTRVPFLFLATERTEQARRAAQDDSDNAWKAVVPFVVLARKASAKAALEDAGKQLAALKAQAASACPHAPSSSFI
jgi:hypothetical protein